MNDWNIDEIIRRYSPYIHCEDFALETKPDQLEAVSYADIQESYELMANIIAVHGEEYLPIFERLHGELENHQKKRKLLSKAFEISNKLNDTKKQ